MIVYGGLLPDLTRLTTRCGTWSLCSRRYFNRSCGLVGYPNVGKSTLFNALAQSQVRRALFERQKLLSKLCSIPPIAATSPYVIGHRFCHNNTQWSLFFAFARSWLKQKIFHFARV